MLDVKRRYRFFLQPVLDRIRDELRTIVGTNMFLDTIYVDRLFLAANDLFRANRSAHSLHQTTSSILVDQAQYSETSSMLNHFVHKAPAPALVSLTCMTTFRAR